MAHSRHTVSSIRTVDDVLEKLSLYEDRHGDASRKDAVKFVMRECAHDRKLMDEAVKSIHSPLVHLAPIGVNTRLVVKSMAKNCVVLGGYQATAYFYPIVGMTEAPWEFYCDDRITRVDSFVSDILQSGMHELVEDVKSQEEYRVIHIRGNINGSTHPINIRIYSAPKDVYSSILSLKSSCEQSILSAYGAVCFWPRLNSRSQYRKFVSNCGTDMYPRGRASIPLYVSSLSPVRPRLDASVSVYSATDKKTEVVHFDNELGFSRHEVKHGHETLSNLVYAVSSNSTMFLGSTAGMK